MLNVPIKIIRVINFLSKKNNSVRFQLNFVSFNFSGILLIAVQYSSSRVSFDTDSQSVPLSRLHFDVETDSILSSISTTFVHEHNPATNPKREDERSICTVDSEQLSLVS